MRIVFAAVFFCVAGAAQVSAPLVGWLPETGAIRPIIGLPGAAFLGDPLRVGQALANAAVSPKQDYILATSAETRQVLRIAPNGSSAALDVPLNPDQIVISPGGSSAAIFYSETGAVEILSGLPDAPAARAVAVNFSPRALAVSDDGQWIAAASPDGVFAWDANGGSRLVYSGNDAAAVAFSAQSSSLLIATPEQLLLISDPGGATGASVLAQGNFAPAGLSASPDRIVLANKNGTLYSIDSGGTAAFDCQCRPGGVFALGHDVFRLTTASAGPVMLFDAAAGAIFAVPRAGITPKRAMRPAQTGGAALPALTINLSPFPNGYLQQPSMTVSASAAYSSDITGTVTLIFASSVGGSDSTIQFSTGGTTVNFTIPAGSTQANFSGAPSVKLSTGTVAGTTTLTAAITAPQSVASAAVQSFTTTPTPPFISNVSFTTTPGAVTVVITGFSSTRDVASAVFNFAPSSNATINESNNMSNPNLSVSTSPQFEAWFNSTTSYATGSEFTLTVPFSVSGNSADIVAVTVTLINSKGASTPVSPK
ncbi:MAG TPA: hypothetical protein VKX39_13485 [Bryobacteraceae bacterium]|nr:hypothetical protein [Bryobacteraceae bacterium]